MRILLLSWLFLNPLLNILFGINPDLVSGQCLNPQKSLLFQLKNSLIFSSSVSTKLINWNQRSTDCCHWSGVTCNNAGRVIGLDLDSESISGGIDNSSALFRFEFLERLNLANNKFNFSQIPQRLGNISSLTYLNLSNAGFAGQIPMELSSMTRLVTLDLSTFFPGIPPLKLENPNLSRLVQNLIQLRELHLDSVNISAHGKEWCQALSSSLPNLRVLSLSNCNLWGPIDSDLLKLRNLSVIILSQNNLSTTVPEFFTNFMNLTVLRLSSCNLQGTFPDKIFLQVSTLQTLDLSNNGFLYGFLPEFHNNGSLENLVLSDTNFSGRLPNSIDNLRMLSRIELVNYNFSGPIPNSMANLTQLVYLDLSSNKFTGSIPSFQKSKNLTHIDLSRNNLTGQIPFDGLPNLVYIDLSYNSLNGSITSSLLALPSLQELQLSFNRLGGQVDEFSNASSSLLRTLDLSSNNLEGPIPTSFFELGKLNVLLLSSNNFSGLVNLGNIYKLHNLTTLDLSCNSLSIVTSGNKSSLSAFPRISTLKLVSCKLRSFPDLKNQSRLVYLDLSDNQIEGDIPNWIWKVGNESVGLAYLNLSRNLLVDVQEPYSIPTSLSVLDLHSNQLHGKTPEPPAFATYVDYSSNNFSSFIPDDIGAHLGFAYFFSLSKNSLTGVIPESICNASYLQVLDLSNNHLNGTIPSCLVEMSNKSLGVMNLQNNNLSGNISGSFPNSCALKTLDLSGNHLEGQVPQSLAKCVMLEVLNLGNNIISDNFPCFLRNLSTLRVLVLRSNRFQGGIHCQGGCNNSWSNLQIIDLASNYFSGNLPGKCLLNWRAMILDKNDSQSKLNHLRFEVLQFNGFYYQDTVTVTIKGVEVELVKILTVFTSIDVSNNRFQGKIPETVGNLTSLILLNLSHNALTGSIPTSMGNLIELESFDLSMNKLNGVIPTQLTNLTFLSVLNLSYNQLVGQIPTGTQLQSFSATSFEGNEGLCGPPLTTNCNKPAMPPSSPPFAGSTVTQFDWQFIFIGLGFGVGAGIIVGPLMFWKQGRNWWDEHTDKFVLIVLSMFGFIYASCEDKKVEAEENIEEEHTDDSGISDIDEDEREETIRRRYCVFCSKLDISRERVIHNPKCTCHDSTLMSSFSTSISSSS